MVYKWQLSKAVMKKRERHVFNVCTAPFSPIYSDSKFRYFAEHSKQLRIQGWGKDLDLDPNPDSASSYSQLVTSLTLSFHICEMGA